MSAPSLRRGDDDTQPIPVVRGRHAAPRPRRSPSQWALLVAREAGIVAAIVVAVVIVGRLVLGQIAFVADDSMEPTLRAGERVLVSGWGEPQPGDVVLVQAPAAWDLTTDTAFARLIAQGGQRVACCDESGRITVDGVALEESYLDGPTDQVPFEVDVPVGRVFVLSDARDTARDSRAPGLPQGGTLSVDDVLGRVTLIVWPPRGTAG